MKNNSLTMKFLFCGTVLIFFALVLPDTGSAAGWYVRGAVGYEKSRNADFSDTNCSSTNPPALFGCINGNNGQPIGASGDFGSFPLGELAFGRQFLPWLRGDLSVAYRFDMNYEGNANFINVGTNQPVSAKADSWSGMVNLFVDLNGLMAGKKMWRFRPYAGCGVGLSHNRLGRMTFLFPQNPGLHKISVTPSGDRTDMAFMLAVGTGIELTEHVTMDIAYRYFDLGRVGTSSGNLYMDVRPAGIAVDSIESRLRTHGLAVGLRYHF